MGYNLTIGNAEQRTPESAEKIVDGYDGDIDSSFRAHVPGVRLDNAPHDDSPTDYTNSRWPSYTAWSDFCNDTGLYSLFYNQSDGLLRNHPGCFVLTQYHLDQIKAVAGNVPKKQKGRYEWLVFWVEWALANCKLPAIYNS